MKTHVPSTFHWWRFILFCMFHQTHCGQIYNSNFDWTKIFWSSPLIANEKELTLQVEIKKVQDNLRGIDIFVNYWGAMKNNIKHSRISEKKFREILKYFWLDIEAKKTSEPTKISRPTDNKECEFTYNNRDKISIFASVKLLKITLLNYLEPN